MIVRESVLIGGRPLTLETGRLAKQAHGSVLVSFGESVVLVTAVSNEERPGIDFFPLTCEYMEKTYAAGKIPGGFFKREGRLRDAETLTSRLIDRPMRPLFPKGFKKDTQVIATVLSSDKLNPTDVLAVTGASAALHISDIPWDGPVAGIRVGRVDGEFIAYPTFAQMHESDIDLVVAASRDAIVMVEGGAAEANESDVIDALIFAQREVQPILDLIERMRSAIGKEKRPFSVPVLGADVRSRVRQIADGRRREVSVIREKKVRYDGYDRLEEEVCSTLANELGQEAFGAQKGLIAEEFEHRKAAIVRAMVLDEGKRIDGRDTKTIRPISCEVGLLPRCHGSALFQRGETQVVATATLGTAGDEQKIDALIGESYKQFMLHYNFPPYSTGEIKPLRGPGRREIGHGALAERALSRMLPAHDTFPYTVRVVSEVLESNGSSSMASVCGGTLSLMDCGVPMKAPVAGIAMGLIMENDRVAILSDILGDEDHLGDMDFKVCGTSRGVTAIQMDIKIKGLSREILERALAQAREGRLFILDKMLSVISSPRAEISRWAPRITTIRIKPDQIRIVIGPGGKTIKGIIDQTGCSVDVNDDGTISVAGSDPDAVRRAIDIVQGLTAEPEVGRVYKGTVKRVVDFGVFVEILPNVEALLHVSEISHERIESPSDVFSEGDETEVKVISVDREGRVRLTRRELLPLPEGEEGERAKERIARAREAGAPQRGGDRGGGRFGGDRRDGGGGRDRGGPRHGGGRSGGPGNRDR
jgi:polyribonucleotide nucleotidyltransferase